MVFSALVYFVYLCDAVICYFAHLAHLFYLCVVVMIYHGCYYFNYIWRPLLGYIMEYVKLHFLFQENLQFQNIQPRRYGPVPITFCFVLEIFLVSFCWINAELNFTYEG